MDKKHLKYLGGGLVALFLGWLGFREYQKHTARTAPRRRGKTEITQDSKRYYLTGPKGSKIIQKSELRKIYEKVKDQYPHFDYYTWEDHKIDKIALLLS